MRPCKRLVLFLRQSGAGSAPIMETLHAMNDTSVTTCVSHGANGEYVFDLSKAQVFASAMESAANALMYNHLSKMRVDVDEKIQVTCVCDDENPNDVTFYYYVHLQSGFPDRSFPEVVTDITNRH